MRALASSMAFILATIALVGAVACESDGEDAPAGSTQVKVELNEWTVKASPATTRAGEVTFAVRNKGVTAHEFAVLKTDLPAETLPQANDAVDEKQLVPLGRTANISGGKSEEKTLSLTAGKYVLLCNIPGHYNQGMRTAFTVN